MLSEATVTVLAGCIVWSYAGSCHGLDAAAQVKKKRKKKERQILHCTYYVLTIGLPSLGVNAYISPRAKERPPVDRWLSSESVPEPSEAKIQVSGPSPSHEASLI